MKRSAGASAVRSEVVATRDIRTSMQDYRLRRLRAHLAARRARGGVPRRAAPGARSASCARTARCTRGGSARGQSRPTTAARRPAARAAGSLLPTSSSLPKREPGRGRARRPRWSPTRVLDASRRDGPRRPASRPWLAAPGRAASELRRAGTRSRAPARSRGSDQRRAEGRVRGRSLQRLRASAHDRWRGALARACRRFRCCRRRRARAPSRSSSSWELCWYRYEVDLSDEIPTVRVAGQGYELDELAPEERKPNASADDNGSLTLAR